MKDDLLLVADCGSTKCEWLVADSHGSALSTHKGPGLNPALLPEESIAGALAAIIPVELPGRSYRRIFFYGAGIRSDRERQPIAAALGESLLCDSVTADSDIAGAAKAVCGDSPGITCILGTGSNAAIYDPTEGITDSIPPLGFILGDEGSAADIGKALVNAALKRGLPAELSADLLAWAGTDAGGIIENVYRKPGANLWIGGLARWASAHIESGPVSKIVISRFLAFLERNVLTLRGAEALEAGFVGSVAAAFEPQLRAAAEACGVKTGKILKSPAAAIAAAESKH